MLCIRIFSADLSNKFLVFFLDPLLFNSKLNVFQFIVPSRPDPQRPTRPPPSQGGDQHQRPTQSPQQGQQQGGQQQGGQSQRPQHNVHPTRPTHAPGKYFAFI